MKTQKHTFKKVLLFLSAFLIFIGLHCQANAAGSVTLTGAVDCIVPVGNSTGDQCDGEASTTSVTASSPVSLELSWAVDIPSTGEVDRIFLADPVGSGFNNYMTLTIDSVEITQDDIPDGSTSPVAHFSDGVLVSFDFDWLDATVPYYGSNLWTISASGDSGAGDTNIQFEFIELNDSGDWFQGYINFPTSQA